MPSPSVLPSLPSFDLSPIYRNHAGARNDEQMVLLRRMRMVMTSFKIMLTMDPTLRAVWPVLNGVRVAPSGIYDYIQHHLMRLPCCLCVLEFDNEQARNQYFEVKVILVTTGTLAGEYVALCATGRCKYFMPFERCYNSRAQPVKAYPVRGETDPIAPGPPLEGSPVSSLTAFTSSVTPPPAASGVVARPRDPIVLQPVLSNVVAPLPAIIATAQPPPLPVCKTTFDLLLKLDDCDQPGLTETQFRNLFVKCSNCHLFTTKSAFVDHHCRTLLPIAPQSTEIIDLTLDDD
ncbi:hypothetical protein GGX14DRAFT_678963 [Mycena pura]|uniref:Uncharacterized protein n=1 Tax=Mycena pura TaxID=153505 RepID=A0AAD6XZW1_9AGAR|nr:hypothetical protein GGX14DRAFT_678963 [Mycena pura]